MVGLKYFLNKFKWMGIFNSPFKRPRLNLYIGRVSIGTPYFYPRNWVKQPDGSIKAVPKKIGFDFVGLGCRFEWGPLWSFVFFKWQIAIIFSPKLDGRSGISNYWESWLFYKNYTDKSKSKKDRLEECILNFPQISTIHESGKEKYTVNWYEQTTKSKYNKVVEKATQYYYLTQMVKEDEELGLYDEPFNTKEK